MSDKLLDMKKITSREFQKRFGQITEKMRVGDTIQVTKRGKIVGRFEKLPEKPIKVPDFAAEAEKGGYSKDVGDRLIKLFNESLS